MNLNIHDDPALEKFLADLTAVDFKDLGGEEFRGHHVNAEKWRKYRQVTKAVRTIQDKDGKSVLRIHHSAELDPVEDSAAVMAVFPQAVGLNSDTKTAFALAALLCDDIAMTTMNDTIRISFVVNGIWAD